MLRKSWGEDTFKGLTKTPWQCLSKLITVCSESESPTARGPGPGPGPISES